jgi:hypothetical protein
VYDKEARKNDARNELETALRLKLGFEPARRDLKRLKKLEHFPAQNPPRAAAEWVLSCTLETRK